MALVKTKEIAQLLDIPSTRVTALEARDESFPRAVRISRKTLRWELEDVKNWINNKKVDV